MPTMTVLNKQSRLGTATTGTAAIPASPPELLIATILIDLADMEDLATHVELVAEVSGDNGSTWDNIGSATWDGGPQNPKGGATPAWRFTTDQLPKHAGKQLRGVLTNSPRIQIGLSVTV